PEAEEENEREERGEDRPPRRRADALRVEDDVVLREQVLELDLGLRRRVVDGALGAVDLLVVDLLLVRVEREVLELARVGLDLLLKRRIGGLQLLVAAAHERLARQVDEQNDHDQGEERATEKAIHKISNARVAPLIPP